MGRESYCLRITAVAAALGTGLLGGCGNTFYTDNNSGHAPEGLEIGASTTVRVRADGVGTAQDTPAKGQTDRIDSTDEIITGTLHDLNEDWIVIDASGERRWVKTESVRWVRQPTER